MIEHLERGGEFAQVVQGDEVGKPFVQSGGVGVERTAEGIAPAGGGAGAEELLGNVGHVEHVVEGGME